MTARKPLISKGQTFKDEQGNFYCRAKKDIHKKDVVRSKDFEYWDGKPHTCEPIKSPELAKLARP